MRGVSIEPQTELAMKLLDCAMTYEEIGKVLGISASVVREIEQTAIKKLRYQIAHHFPELQIYYEEGVICGQARRTLRIGN